MITEILVMGILGLVSAIGLELASGVLGEEVNEDMEAIMEILPEWTAESAETLPAKLTGKNSSKNPRPWASASLSPKRTRKK